MRRGNSEGFALRQLLARVLGGFALLVLTTLPAQATLLPEGFFDQAPPPGKTPAAVEADQMSYDGGSGMVAAEGAAVLSYAGYTLRADKIEYDQAKGSVRAVGHVVLRDPTGDVLTMDSIEVTGGLKEAFLNSLTLTTSSGAVIGARSVDFKSDLETVLTDASYSPCGLCIDSKGRKVGWKVKAAKITYDRNHASVTLQQPSLELLGIPVAWLPWFWIPDPTQPRATGLRFPSVDFDAKRGAVVAVPYFVPMALGAAYFRSGQVVDAEREYKVAIEANPASGETHSNLAVLYLTTDRVAQAAAEIDLAEKTGFKVNSNLKDDIRKRKGGS